MDDRIICIYHGHCADGLGAAWAVHRKFGDQVEFVAGNYGRGLPKADYTNRDVLIVDFSFPAETLKELALFARSVLVLDHHKSAQDQLAHIHPPAHYDWKTWRTNLLVEDQSTRNDDDNMAGDWLHCNLAAIFDMNRSGAGITWDFLFSNYLGERPKIINLVESRDLWRLTDENRSFHAILTSYELGEPTEMPRGGEYPSRLAMLDEWHKWSENIPEMNRAHDEWYSLIQGGRDILRSNDALVASFVKSTRRSMKIGGHIVPVANLPGNFASDAGHLMCNPPWDINVLNGPPPFSATYYDGADGKRHFSLRSSDDGADVSVIARNYGGGGHVHAAGFDRPMGWEGES